MTRILEDYTEDELIKHIRANLTGGHASYEAARGELLRRAMLQVSKNVESFNQSSTRLAWVMIALTIVIALLTVAMIWLPSNS